MVAAGLAAAYAVQIAVDEPEAIAALGLVVPLGIESHGDEPDFKDAMVHRLLRLPVVGTSALNLYTSRSAIDHHLLEAYAVEERVDAALVEHHYRSSHQPGARGRARRVSRRLPQPRGRRRPGAAPGAGLAGLGARRDQPAGRVGGPLAARRDARRARGVRARRQPAPRGDAHHLRPEARRLPVANRVKGFPEVPGGYPFPALELEVLADWRRRRIFERSLERTAGGEEFVFYEGPPTANNVPHVGHVVTRVVKDLIPRYRTMRGRHVRRKGGWDTHGLPVEIEVEKRLGFTGKREIEAYGIAAFNRACLESVHTYEEKWREMSERVGYWIDLDDAYFTYSNSYIESVWWALADAVAQGAARRELQDPALLRALRHHAVEPRGGAELQGGRRPVDLDDLPPAARAARASDRRRGGGPRRRRAGGLDDDALDDARQRRGRRPSRAALQAGRASRARRASA